MQYMCIARMTVNIYNFNKTINITYVTWTSAKLAWTNIVILKL